MVGANFIDLNVKSDATRPKEQQWSYKWKNSDKKQRGQMIKDFVRYIGRIDGTAIDESCINNHSIFGKFIDENRNLEQLSMKELRKYTGSIAEKGIEMFNTVISLKEDEAILSGFIDRETWKNMINKKIKDIAEEYGIEQSNLEYVASVHSDDGHIHCHLVFWKRNELEDGRINKKKNYSKIRKELNKEIFKKELEKNYDLQNSKKKEIGTRTKNFLDDNLKNSIKELTPNLYSKYFNNKISNKSLDRIEKCISQIVETQKKISKENNSKIRYIYKYQPPEVKDLLLKTAKEIVNSNLACSKEFSSYIKATVEINKILGKIGKKNTAEVVKQKAENEMLIKISNNILEFIKSEKKEEFDLKGELYKERQEEYQLQQEKYKRRQLEFERNMSYYQLRKLCRNSYNTCQNNNTSQRATLSNVINYSNLTKTAKKERYLKNKFRGSIDWER